MEDIQVLIVGGGPAGMMAGYLFARAGVRTLVLEKHGDFLRDFRGDTVHPSTLDLFDELGLYDRFLERPHDKVEQLSASVGGESFAVADFKHLPGRATFIALMPQWEFLDFLAGEARKLPAFALSMEIEATGLIEEDGRVRVQPCVSPVWDTAIATIALADAKLPAYHPALLGAVRWLLDKEVRIAGETQIDRAQFDLGWNKLGVMAPAATVAAEMIFVPSCWARRMAAAVLPTAVGPTMTKTVGP